MDLSGIALMSNHPVAVSTNIISVRTLSVPALPVIVYGSNRSRPTVFYDIMVAVLGGTFPYFFLCFLNFGTLDRH